MDGFEDVAVLHADAQALGLAFAGQLATQAAEVRIFGDLDLEHEQGVIAVILAQNGLEAVDVDAVTGKDAAHGSDEAGAVGAVHRDHEGLADHGVFPAAFHGWAHQHGKVELGIHQAQGQLGVQGFFRGIGDLKVTLYSTFMNMFGRVVAVFVMIRLLQMEFASLAWANMVGWIVMLLFEVPLLVKSMRNGECG